MTQIYANNFTTLVLGRRGENLARQVVFDIRDLESLYGHGDVEVIYQRPCDEQPYPLTVQREGTLVTWDVTSTDTEMSDGSGKCELRYYVEETLAKSKTWRTWVEPAMDTPSETDPPEPEPVPVPREMTPAEKREQAYNTVACVEWDGDMLTVTQAAQKWMYYAAEGRTDKTDKLTALIAAAKQSIREALNYDAEEADLRNLCKLISKV